MYERTESLNTGIDPILEISHQLVGSGSIYNSRILLKFDATDIEEKILSGEIGSNAKYYLALRTVEAREIPQEYVVEAFPVSASWVNGTGKYDNAPKTTDGVSWTYRTSKQIGIRWEIPPATSSFEWDTISDQWVDSSLIFGSIATTVSSSYYSKQGGGTWWDFDNVHCTQSFEYQSSDVYMDVTPIVRKWTTGSGRFNNDGIIVKFTPEIEGSLQSLSSLKFFSTDSNTIYVPRLHVVWDDSVFNTGSLLPVSNDNFAVNVKLKKHYADDERAKIRIYANTKYPTKAYTTQSYYTQNYYLPTSSYYEIRDAHTDEVILPFNTTGSKISCDGTSSYFNLWMDSFQPERFYRVVVKVDYGINNTQIFDNSYYFKVTR
jgi:hypothetical protein